MKNIQAEDGLNIIRSDFVINDLVIINSANDCLDLDFSRGTIEQSIFVNCGNDGIDFSGSYVTIREVKVINPGDKGMSFGELTEATVESSEVIGGYVSIASKDLSSVNINDLTILNATHGVAVYQKKPEFGPGAMSITDINDEPFPTLVEKGSELYINGKRQDDNANKVESYLYGEGEGLI